MIVLWLSLGWCACVVLAAVFVHLIVMWVDS
jgi:hypothetical protein